MDEVLKSYSAHARELARAWGRLDAAEVLAPVLDMLPATGRALDIGAGTGRDAIFLAASGLTVLAVEPVGAFWPNEMTPGVTWHHARLPALSGLPVGRFDLVLVNGVLHHLAPADQYAALDRCSTLLVPSGLLVLSLRHGPGAPDRPVYPCEPAALLNRAKARGLRVARRAERQAVQGGNRSAGVTWTWLALRAGGSTLPHT